jgi:hypothetical protein
MGRARAIFKFARIRRIRSQSLKKNVFAHPFTSGARVSESEIRLLKEMKILLISYKVYVSVNFKFLFFFLSKRNKRGVETAQPSDPRPIDETI